MAMTERDFSAYSYEEAQSFAQRRLRVLDGRAVREKRNARRADIVKITLAVTAVMVYLLAVTMMEAKIGNLVNRINTLEADIEDTINASLRTDLEIGELSSLERIEEYATAELGMIRPGVEDIHYLNGESSGRILAGQNQSTQELEAEPIEATIEQESTFLQSIGRLLKGYWNGQALAADPD